MDIILLEHIEDLGTVGQTVKVKDGYARNYLLPRKLACLATENNQRFYRTLIESRRKKLAKAKQDAETQAEMLKTVSLIFVRKSRDEDSRLFGSVTNVDIAAALAEKGYEIDRKRISIPDPIKRLGEHQALVRLHPEVNAPIVVIVKSDEEVADAV